MLVLNFMYMKKNLFRFSSRRFLFSTVMASVLVTGAPQAVFANVGEVQAVSQTGAIKGKIVDSYGEPVIGANVKVKGTTNGTITDMDGNFTLNNVSGGTLVISFIGYKTLEVFVKGTNLTKIIMHEDTEVLDEVVVVGYGTQKKESLTGSVTVVDQKLLRTKVQWPIRSQLCKVRFGLTHHPLVGCSRRRRMGCLNPWLCLKEQGRTSFDY